MPKCLNFVIVLLATLFLAGCAETELVSHMAKQFPDGGGQSEGNFKVGKPYHADGRTYTPQESYDYTETGIASWYGTGFQGRRTANGEKFDMNELTAAHRTLQMPSFVRVTNLENGRSLVVRINDRGPFKRGRVIDVSKKAAELLGFAGTGTAKVKLQVLSEESKQLAMAARRGEDTRGTEMAMNDEHYQPISARVPLARAGMSRQALYQTASIQPVEVQPMQEPVVSGHINNGNFMPDAVVQQLPVTPTNIYIQAGAFSDPGNAQRLASTLQQYGSANVYQASVGGQTFNRVRIGPIPNVDAADALLARMAKDGYSNAVTIVE